MNDLGLYTFIAACLASIALLVVAVFAIFTE